MVTVVLLVVGPGLFAVPGQVFVGLTGTVAVSGDDLDGDLVCRNVSGFSVTPGDVLQFPADESLTLERPGIDV